MSGKKSLKRGCSRKRNKQASNESSKKVCCKDQDTCPYAFFFGCCGDYKNCPLKKMVRDLESCAGKCPACGSTDIREGIYAGGGPDGHWEEDVCNKCGKHFNCIEIRTE